MSQDYPLGILESRIRSRRHGNAEANYTQYRSRRMTIYCANADRPSVFFGLGVSRPNDCCRGAYSKAARL